MIDQIVPIIICSIFAVVGAAMVSFGDNVAGTKIETDDDRAARTIKGAFLLVRTAVNASGLTLFGASFYVVVTELLEMFS